MPKTPFEIYDGHPLTQVRFIATIPRYSVVPVVRRQSVGEHCFLVARYCMILAEVLKVTDKALVAILEYALVHDDDEAITGDIPTPVKAKLGYTSIDERIKEGRPMVYWFVKFCDRLEAVKYMVEERMLGNRIMDELLAGAVGRLVEAADELQAYFETPLMETVAMLEGANVIRCSDGGAEDDPKQEGVPPGNGPWNWQNIDDLKRILGIQGKRPN